MCDLIKIEDTIGKWTDIMVRANYSPSNKSPVDVWINGRKVGCSLNKPLTINKNIKYNKVAFQYGIYQQSIDKLLGRKTPTAVMYYDAIKVGYSRDDVNIFYDDAVLDMPPAGNLNLDPNYGSFARFDRVENNTTYGYILKRDNTLSAPTRLIEVFELRDGDCISYDCESDKERSEMMQQPKDNNLGDEYWYGWSIFFPEEYNEIHPASTVLNRFTHKKEEWPLWRFGQRKNAYGLSGQPLGKGSERLKFKIFGGKNKNLKGEWHKIEVQVKWSKDNSGFFRVWSDGEQKVDYSGPTIIEKNVGFRYGLNRIGLSRYKDKFDVDKVPTQKVYFSNVKRADTREGLSP